ncbi:MAG: coniferyl aldehyde dehydrogenase [Wenzhouxiangellaceae bacterium]
MHTETSAMTSTDPAVDRPHQTTLQQAAAGEIAAPEIRAVFDLQKSAYLNQPYPSLAQRRESLTKLAQWVRNNLEAIQQAAAKDFGCRSADETLLTEVMGTLKSITYSKRHLKRWMRPQRRPVDISFQPASARVVPQPLGVVGVVAPWNYPFGLVLKPLISALSAGNRVMIKPSELTPNISALLRTMMAELFNEDEVAVIEGGPETAKAFIALPFDHLLFTGGTNIGKLVMAAAAPNLTPLTLELGGKSPVIIDDRIDMQRAVKSIATGKLLNSGQTCTAPDYVLVPQGRLREFVDTFCATAQRMYPDPVNNPDFTSIINSKHYERLQGYLDDAREHAAEIVEVYPGEKSQAQTRKLVPTLVVNPPAETSIMQEEIFGPLMVVIPYRDLSDAVAFINARPRPLALYLFSDSQQTEDYVLKNTTAGGVTINDTLLHYTQESLPFGGVGHSGFGAYHGDAGFTAFSHYKAVFRQARLNSLDLLRAPYNKTSRWLLKNIIKIS